MQGPDMPSGMLSKRGKALAFGASGVLEATCVLGDAETGRGVAEALSRPLASVLSKEDTTATVDGLRSRIEDFSTSFGPGAVKAPGTSMGCGFHASDVIRRAGCIWAVASGQHLSITRRCVGEKWRSGGTRQNMYRQSKTTVIRSEREKKAKTHGGHTWT